MVRILDKLAEAFDIVQGARSPRRVVTSLALRDQFRLPITPTRWRELQRVLDCPLPPLVRLPAKLWSFPRGLQTVLDLAHFLAIRRPYWEAPARGTSAEWREAQVFLGVRAALVEAGNLDETDIVRSARLQADLGFD